MTSLFHRLQPVKKLRITLLSVAKLLKIFPSLILRVEKWQYILFVHRRDRGGQFISYRQLVQWQNAIACRIQNCSNRQELGQIQIQINQDQRKFKKQYQNAVTNFIQALWQQCWQKLETEKLVSNSTVATRTWA